jgi:hypothetical protein
MDLVVCKKSKKTLWCNRVRIDEFNGKIPTNNTEKYSNTIGV